MPNYIFFKAHFSSVAMHLLLWESRLSDIWRSGFTLHSRPCPDSAKFHQDPPWLLLVLNEAPESGDVTGFVCSWNIFIFPGLVVPTQDRILRAWLCKKSERSPTGIHTSCQWVPHGESSGNYFLPQLGTYGAEAKIIPVSRQSLRWRWELNIIRLPHVYYGYF